MKKFKIIIIICFISFLKKDRSASLKSVPVMVAPPKTTEYNLFPEKSLLIIVALINSVSQSPAEEKSTFDMSAMLNFVELKIVFEKFVSTNVEPVRSLSVRS